MLVYLPARLLIEGLTRQPSSRCSLLDHLIEVARGRDRTAGLATGPRGLRWKFILDGLVGEEVIKTELNPIVTRTLN
jgi:hypothetical protein